jgi:hypothetical protein
MAQLKESISNHMPTVSRSTSPSNQRSDADGFAVYAMPTYNWPSVPDVLMPFSIRPFRRFPVQCSVLYNAGPFQGQGTVGIFHVLDGDSPVIYRCDQETPLTHGHTPE